MTGTTVVPNDRLILALGILLPFALTGCGKDGEKPIEITRIPASSSEAKATQAGGLPVNPEVVVPKMVTVKEAETLIKDRKFIEARAGLELYVESQPSDAFGHYLLGIAAWKSGDHRRAEKAFSKAIELDRNFVKSYLNSARVLLEMKRNQEALERAELALTVDPTSVDGMRILARAQSAVGLTGEALETYRRAIVTKEDDVWTLNNLGTFYLETGDAQAALGPLARAVQLKGTSPVFQNNLGMALELAGFKIAAKEAYRAAIQADSTYQKAVANLARLEAVVIDSTVVETVDLDQLASDFRAEIVTWREQLQPKEPAVDSVKVDSAEVKDSASSER